MTQMQLPPKPTLRSVQKITKNNKDVDFLQFFDSNKSGLYLTVRHRYNQLVDVVANGISHLKLFTKHLKTIIDAQQTSADSCLAIIEQYRQEEPTFASFGFTKLQDETSIVNLPPQFSDQKTGINDAFSDIHRKTDIDAFTDIWGFERNMAKLFALYWKRLNQEIHSPLLTYQQSLITKYASITEYVASKYDKLIKFANKLRESKIATLAQWNELCDARHTLRKLKTNTPDSNKTKKQLSRCKSIENKCKKLFEHIIQNTDKFNNMQDEFWNEVIKNAVLQLEAMEYTRICFYQEYFDKYADLLKWRRAELQNGEKTLDRARQMMMSPFEIAELGIHPIRIDFGNYNPIAPQQYELPCMPDEVTTLTGKITEQRIDPSILSQVYNPFGNDLKPQTSKHKKSNFSRSGSVIIHDRMDSTRSISGSMSSMSSISHTGVIGGMPFNSKSFISAQPTNSFFAANKKHSLFARTNRTQTHAGGLPAPAPASPSYSNSLDNSVGSHKSNHGGASPPPNVNTNTPQLPTRRAAVSKKSSPMSPPPKKRPPKRRSMGNNDSPFGKPPSIQPSLPPRPNLKVGTKPKRSATPTGTLNKPALPPRRKTLPNKPPGKPPPNKSATNVAKNVRKSSNIYDKTPPKPAKSPPKNKNAKKKSKWTFGK